MACLMCANFARQRTTKRRVGARGIRNRGGGIRDGEGLKGAVQPHGDRDFREVLIPGGGFSV